MPLAQRELTDAFDVRLYPVGAIGLLNDLATDAAGEEGDRDANAGKAAAILLTTAASKPSEAPSFALEAQVRLIACANRRVRSRLSLTDHHRGSCRGLGKCTSGSVES